MRALMARPGLVAWAAIALVRLTATTASVVPAEPRSEEAILARVQALDLPARRRVELARLQRERGTLDPAIVASEVRRFSANPAALEAQLPLSASWSRGDGVADRPRCRARGFGPTSAADDRAAG